MGGVGTVSDLHVTIWIVDHRTLANGLCQNNVGDAIDTIVQIQEKLFDFGISLSGFQFVGIVFESSTLQTAPDYMKVSYF